MGLAEDIKGHVARLGESIKESQDWRSVSQELSHVDDQHRQIYVLLDKLKKQTERHEEGAELEKTLLFLKDYVAFHFLNEERLMYEHGYDRDRYWAHANEHKAASRAVEALMKRFKEGANKEALAKEVRVKVIDWLDTHIRTFDAEMMQYLKAHATRKEE